MHRIHCPSLRISAVVAAGSLLLAAGSLHAADDPKIEKCSTELGTLAVAEPQAHVLSGLQRHGLGSPAVMLRMMVQESGCFAVVERGAAMQNLQQERALAAGGQLQAGSNIGGGQMAVADFVMTPMVQFSGETGGVGGSIGGLLNKAGLGALSGIAGGVKFKEAETNLLIADVRSGIQVASAEGKASKMNFAVGGWGWAGLGWAGGGGYTKTPEGKLIAASLLDNYNRIVQQVRDKPSLVRSTSAASRQNAANSLAATGNSAAAQMPAAAPAAPSPAPTVARAAAGGVQGHYSGSLAGDGGAGDFLISVAADGQVSGMGRSGGATFTFTGLAAASGLVMLRGQAPSGPIELAGQIDAVRGEISGTWKQPQGGGQGTFSGKRAQ
jgi:curli biogenesis system outer membrane secretion channel CsgG